VDIHGKPLGTGDAGTEDAGTEDAGSGDGGAPAGDGAPQPHDAAPPAVHDAASSPDATLAAIQRCIRLGNVCHAGDDGSGPVHECHGIGHDGDLNLCAEHYDRCIALCEAASP
jgi:hypothetical protein